MEVRLRLCKYKHTFAAGRLHDGEGNLPEAEQLLLRRAAAVKLTQFPLGTRNVYTIEREESKRVSTCKQEAERQVMDK